MRALIRSGIFLSACVFILGCGDGNYKGGLKGKVTYNGAPVSGGMIRFSSSDFGDFNCGIAADGSYNIQDIPSTTFTIYVDNESLNPKKAPPEYNPASIAKAAGNNGTDKMAPVGMSGRAPGKGPNSAGTPKGSTKGAGVQPPPAGVTVGDKGHYVELPSKYRTVGKSDITVKVTGPMEFNVELK